MVSLVIASGKSHAKRDALLKDIGQQDFPAQALQVVLVSQKSEAFKQLPEVEYDLRTVIIKDRKHKSAMVDIAIRQCSGDFIYVLDEGAIFDNPNDLLKLYEFLLDNPGVDVCVGYNIEHYMYEPKNDSARIMKSTVLEMDGNTNICLRRKVIQSGFSFSRYLFADNAIDEIQDMGFTVDKLKWLQVHHKKSIPFFMVGVLRSYEWILSRWRKISRVPIMQKAGARLSGIYRSERIRKFGIQLRWWAQDLMMMAFKYSRLVWQYSKVHFLRLKVYSTFASRRLMMAVRHQMEKVRARLRQRHLHGRNERVVEEKVYVPHLESHDRPAPELAEAPDSQLTLDSQISREPEPPVQPMKPAKPARAPLFKIKSQNPEDLDL